MVDGRPPQQGATLLRPGTGRGPQPPGPRPVPGRSDVIMSRDWARFGSQRSWVGDMSRIRTRVEAFKLLSHGVALDSSRRREPWEKCPAPKSRGAATGTLPVKALLPPLPGLVIPAAR